LSKLKVESSYLEGKFLAGYAEGGLSLSGSQTGRSGEHTPWAVNASPLAVGRFLLEILLVMASVNA
jgi:hypothetical protein